MILNLRSWTKQYDNFMEKINHYVSIVNQAFTVAKDNLNNPESLKKAETDKEALINSLKKDSFIKVPFVGDFNAGKSSLINSILGVDILPTNILPETAVSYELYFSSNEKLEVWLDDKLVETAPISQLKSLQLTPRNFVKLYLNNPIVKEWNDRNIVVVDMPGIDSGVEAHNNAILHYVQDGTFFVLVSEVEGGTLRLSTLSFIEEIKKYGAQLAVVVSKIDKKPEQEVLDVKANVESVAKRLLGDSTMVVSASAVNKDFNGVLDILSSIDAEELIVNKYKGQVVNFIDSFIVELQLQMKLMLSDKSDFSEKIESLRNAQAKAVEDLKRKAESAQSVEGSADDILDDISEALREKAGYIATLLYGQADGKALNQEILTIIRPVIVNSLKREITEYSDVVGGALQEFMVNVDTIINDKDNKMLSGAEEIIGNMLGKDILEGLLKKGLDQLAKKLVAYKGLGELVKMLSKILGPLVTILINIIPDIIRMIFGKSKEQKIEEIKMKFTSEIVSKIVESLRQPIEDMIKEQRAEVYNNVSALIDSETQKYNENINAIKNQQQEEEKVVAQKVAALNAVVEKLNVLKTQI